MTDQDKPMIVKAPCPHCYGQIEVGKDVYKCIGRFNSSTGCGLIINGVISGREMSEFEIESLLKYRRVGPLSGFAARNGRSFSASLCLAPHLDGDTLKLEFKFDDAPALAGAYDQMKCTLDDLRTKEMIEFMPASIQKIVEEYNKKRQSIEGSIEDSAVSSLLKAKLLKAINASEITYCAQGAEKPWSQISRTASMLCGPMFLSTNFPRPNSQNGEPMFPLLQMNLSEISRSTHHLFEDSLLQIWLSSADGECQLRIVPYEEWLLPPASILEVSESVFADALNFIPSAWISKSRDCGIEVVDIEPVGVSMPDIELLLDGGFDEDGCKETLEILNLMRSLADMRYLLSTEGGVGAVFNILGYFRSNVYSCWDEDFGEKIFIHTPDWLDGALNFNLFFSQKNKVNGSFRLSITK
jgi:hypothetical protein